MNQKATTEQQTNSPVDTPDQKSIDLDVPINCGSRKISTLLVRRPNSGALRGLKLGDILSFDVNTIQMILPRITEPTLTKAEVMDIDPSDLVTLGVAIATFLAPKADRQDSH